MWNTTKKIIIGNWKMNPKTLKDAEQLCVSLGTSGMHIAPPSVFLHSLAKKFPKISFGAQSISSKDSGAYTGEISFSMIESCGAQFVLVGHSECRARGEGDEDIREKLKMLVKKQIGVVLCVGEPYAIRKKGMSAVERFLEKQLSVLEGLSFHPQKLIIAYEPIWAIGSGIAETPEGAAMIASFIGSFLEMQNKKMFSVLYGGSVSPKNISAFLKEDEIGGVLIGGASVKKSELTSILRVIQ